MCLPPASYYKIRDMAKSISAAFPNAATIGVEVRSICQVGKIGSKDVESLSDGTVKTLTFLLSGIQRDIEWNSETLTRCGKKVVFMPVAAAIYERDRNHFE